MMTSAFRKLNLTAHVTSSVGWIGAVAAFLALAIAGLTSHDAHMVRVAYPAMELIARFVIVPLALASLVSGLIQSLGTPWGLFRHYWVLVKLSLTIFATIVLLEKMPPIGYAARRAAETALSSADLSAGMPLAVHAAGGILVLLVVTALSVYKPWGLTAYGRRMQQEGDKVQGRAVSETPVAVQVLLGAFGVVLLAIAALHHTVHGFGSHGH
jgi:hypothetical protein